MRTSNNTNTFKRADLQACENYEATYCPEDDKLRLYVGRVPRDEYNFLRAEGWTSTPKQSEAGQGEFSAVWTPAREATALHYAGFIGDEDTPPTERAADRTERFGGYMAKRAEEAGQHADNYDSQPSAHGFQSERKAERAAARHDRHGDKATDQWSKAEYWQRRTAGVIEHALHKSSPGVRMGRIKTLEAELRKREGWHEEYARRYQTWQKLAEIEDTPENFERIRNFAGAGTASTHDYKHPRPETVTNSHIAQEGTSLWSLMGMVEREYGTDNITGPEACAMWLATHAAPTGTSPWIQHLRLRLAYENQMLEAQGGRAGDVEMVPGGWLLVGRRGREHEARQIQKVNKSPVTGRVVSVLVQDNRPSFTNHWGNPYPDGIARTLSHTVEIERAGPDCYRAPTAEELAEFQGKQQAVKKTKATAAKQKAAAGENCPLINPTDEDAERLQALMNEHHVAEWIRHHGKPTEHYKPKTAQVERITQACYSQNSKGSYAKAETRGLCANGVLEDRSSNMWSSAANARAKARGPAVCKIRIAGYDPERVLIITDKPQKALPAKVWEQYEPKQEAPATQELQAA